MIYEFWDIRSNNILDAFDSNADAVDAIRNAVRRHGELAVEFVMLLEDDTDREAKTVLAIGSELLAHLHEDEAV